MRRIFFFLLLLLALSACDDGSGEPADAGDTAAADTAGAHDTDTDDVTTDVDDIDDVDDQDTEPDASDTASTDAGHDTTDLAGADTDSDTLEDAGDTALADADADADVPPPSDGIWISRDEILALPMEGPAWEALLADADRTDKGAPVLSDQDQDHNVWILASAMVYVRTGQPSYRDEVRQAIMAAMGTEDGGRTLALARELAAYVIAADLVGLEPDEDTAFRAWLTDVRHEMLDGRTLVSTHEDRPNNWGTHAGASRLAAAVYLGDEADIELAAEVFRGWLGDRAAYAGFSYGELSWQADPDAPVGINPVGAVTGTGESIDGVIPDDMRRGCPLQFPPCPTDYPWEGLQGALVQAEILHRRGHDAWQWQDQALRRAVQLLWDLGQRYPDDGWWADGDDTWQVWLVNQRYGTDFPTVSPSRTGKNIGYTDWTHAETTP